MDEVVFRVGFQEEVILHCDHKGLAIACTIMMSSLGNQESASLGTKSGKIWVGMGSCLRDFCSITGDAEVVSIPAARCCLLLWGPR